MPAIPQPLANARRVFKEYDGILRTSEALRRGIHPRTLYELRDRGEIERVGRGLYRLASAPPLTSPDLVALALRAPLGVVCLISALSHHGLTTRFHMQLMWRFRAMLRPQDGKHSAAHLLVFGSLVSFRH